MSNTNISLPAPANPFPVLDPASFDWEQADDIFGLIKQLVNGDHPGIFSTVDEQGRPHMRWMASLSFDELPWIYTLTDRESRKVRQIERHPAVSWMFCNSDLSLVLNLAGEARVLTDTPTVKRLWKQIHHKEHAYFLKNSQSGLGIAVIATRIQHVACTTPKSSMCFSVQVDQLKRSA